MAAETLQRIRSRQMPKGDVLAMAELAGIAAAKRTSDILPLCHPLGLDGVKVSCEFSDNHSITVSCEAFTTAKTGVEMEALTGVSAALLAIYDLSKGVDPVLCLSDIHLVRKEGGKSGVWLHPKFENVEKVEKKVEHPLAKIRACVLTVSDRCARGETEDHSGPRLRHLLEERGAAVLDAKLVPDEGERIREAVLHFVEVQQADLVVTTGGTGLGPRDVTLVTLSKLFTKPVPGIGELLRQKGAVQTKKSWLSGSEGGLIGQTLVIALPGKPQALEAGIETLETLLPHAVHIAKGGGHP